MVGPLAGAYGDPGAPTNNVKMLMVGPWEVLELEIQERPPSLLRNVDDGPPRRCRSWRSGSAHHQRYETSTVGPLVGADGDLGAPHHQCKKRRQQTP
jgi:hypothetical protein